VAAHVEIEHVLDRPELERIAAAMREGGEPATVSGLAPEGRATSVARRATSVAVPEPVRATVAGLLEELRPRIADHFGRSLDACEEPQFLRYGEGDYFVAHQDGNTPLVHDDTRFRKVSVVIFVSERSDYTGGALVLHDGLGPSERSVELAPPAGTLVAYPSETTHEVLPLAGGERLTIVSWYRAVVRRGLSPG
jgi:SM-20-related protein